MAQTSPNPTENAIEARGGGPATPSLETSATTVMKSLFQTWALGVSLDAGTQDAAWRYLIQLEEKFKTIAHDVAVSPRTEPPQSQRDSLYPKYLVIAVVIPRRLDLFSFTLIT